MLSIGDPAGVLRATRPSMLSIGDPAAVLRATRLSMLSIGDPAAVLCATHGLSTFNLQPSTCNHYQQSQPLQQSPHSQQQSQSLQSQQQSEPQHPHPPRFLVASAASSACLWASSATSPATGCSGPMVILGPDGGSDLRIMPGHDLTRPPTRIRLNGIPNDSRTDPRLLVSSGNAKAAAEAYVNSNGAIMYDAREPHRSSRCRVVSERPTVIASRRRCRSVRGGR